MLSFALKSASVLSSPLNATTQVVASAAKPIFTGIISKAAPVTVLQSNETFKSQESLMRMLTAPTNRAQSNIVAGLGQVRYLHNDHQFPNMDGYRREGTKSVTAAGTSDNSDARKAFSYLMLASTTVPAVYGAKACVTQFISCMSASADVLALSKIEVDLSTIPEGKNVTFKWRNKPLFIRHRPATEIEREEAVSVSDLRDQENDSERVQKSEWLIVLGVCTHLGCVPIANAGEYGGYYCPCHGSHYDASGRIRKGPAPLNLEVPPYTFVDETTLVVG